MRPGGFGALSLLAFLLIVGAAAAQSGESVVAAVRTGDLAAVRALLDAGGVEVDAPAPDGTTALHWAVHRDDVGVVELLIGAGADVNRTNDYGVTPLSLACTNRSAEVVARLLDAGADPEVRTEGETALMTAVRTGSVDVVVGRSDAAGGEHVVVLGAHLVDRVDDGVLGIGDHPRLAKTRTPLSPRTLAMWFRLVSWVRPERISLPIISTQAVTTRSGMVPVVCLDPGSCYQFASASGTAARSLGDGKTCEGDPMVVVPFEQDADTAVRQNGNRRVCRRSRVHHGFVTPRTPVVGTYSERQAFAFRRCRVHEENPTGG